MSTTLRRAAARAQRRRRRGRPAGAARPPLDRQTIARAALALIDAEGLAGFSTRRLGRSLGIEAMSLYHYFDSKDQLLDAVMELLVDEIELRAQGGWLDRLRHAAHTYRAVAQRHPRAFSLLVTRPYTTPRLLQFCDAALGVIAASGCDDVTTARAFRLFGHFLDGSALYVSEGPARRGGPPVPPPAPVDPVRFPHLAAAGPHLSRARADAHFEFALEHVLQLLARVVGDALGHSQQRFDPPHGSPERGASAPSEISTTDSSSRNRR